MNQFLFNLYLYRYHLVTLFVKKLLFNIKWVCLFFPTLIFTLYNISQYNKLIKLFESNYKVDLSIVEVKERQQILAELAENWQIGFQSASNANAEATTIFHNDILVIMGIIFIGTSFILINSLFRFHYKKKPRTKKEYDAQLVELLWTLIPVCIVFIILIPSFALSVTTDAPTTLDLLPEMTIEIIGHQWFWVYKIHVEQIAKFLGVNQEFLDQFYQEFGEPIEIESYILPTTDLAIGAVRNLAVENQLCLPANTQITLLATSEDTIHSWGIPSLDVKIDTVPGRINQTKFDIPSRGTFYGQCSEICGTNHGFMPIELKAVSHEKFAQWVIKIVQDRARQSGLIGLKNYLIGQHGQDDSLLYDSHATVAQKARAKMIKSQSKLLHWHRLKNEFWDWIGYSTCKNYNHLILKNDRLVNESEQHIPMWVDQDTQFFLEKELYPSRRWDQLYFCNDWLKKREGILIYQPRIEPNYICREYSMIMPYALRFVLNCVADIPFNLHYNLIDTPTEKDYENWMDSSLWIEGEEYQEMCEFPRPWGFNNNPVIPVFKEVCFKHQEQSIRYCQKFLTKVKDVGTRLDQDHLQPPHMTIYMQTYNGTIRDTGIPIRKFWETELLYTEMPSLKFWSYRACPQ